MYEPKSQTCVCVCVVSVCLYVTAASEKGHGETDEDGACEQHRTQPKQLKHFKTQMMPVWGSAWSAIARQ